MIDRVTDERLAIIEAGFGFEEDIIAELLQALKAEHEYSGSADLLLAGAKKRVGELKSMLEDVVNELDLSDLAIEQHGPMGTPPAELVKLVLAEKDMKIAALKSGLKVLETK